jgi:hypothetical protein
VKAKAAEDDTSRKGANRSSKQRVIISRRLGLYRNMHLSFNAIVKVALHSDRSLRRKNPNPKSKIVALAAFFA